MGQLPLKYMVTKEDLNNSSIPLGRGHRRMDAEKAIPHLFYSHSINGKVASSLIPTTSHLYREVLGFYHLQEPSQL